MAELGLALAFLVGCDGKTLWLGTLATSADGGGPEAGADLTPADATVDATSADVGADLASADSPPDSGIACVSGQVEAQEVLFIGDSFMLVPLPITQASRVSDLARAANVIGPSDEYVNGAGPAVGLTAIVNQYNTQEAGATKVKVLVMDGGTWETITNGASTAVVNSVASNFTQFLAKVDSDGTVAHIIYVMVPELPSIPGVAALRPLLQDSCTKSQVPCHFLDLEKQLLWTSHPEYTAAAPNDIVPTEAGARAIAEAIWGLMQDNCIAQ